MEWISVKDKLPNEGQIIVVWLSKKKEPTCVEFEIDEYVPKYVELCPVDIYCDREDLVTHWMPIPVPPSQKNPKDLVKLIEDWIEEDEKEQYGMD